MRLLSLGEKENKTGERRRGTGSERKLDEVLEERKRSGSVPTIEIVIAFSLSFPIFSVDRSTSDRAPWKIENLQAERKINAFSFVAMRKSTVPVESRGSPENVESVARVNDTRLTFPSNSATPLSEPNFLIVPR